MKYRHRITGETIEVTEHTGPDGPTNIPGGSMWLGTGDRLVKRADGSYEGYQPTHPIWQDFDEVVETRVVKVEAGKTVAYHAERLTTTGWVRGDAMATLAEAEADMPAKPVEAIVKTYEGGVLTAELAVGDNPETAAVETTFWQKVKSFVGLGDVG